MINTLFLAFLASAAVAMLFLTVKERFKARQEKKRPEAKPKYRDEPHSSTQPMPEVTTDLGEPDAEYRSAFPALLNAASEGDLEGFMQLIHAGEDVNTRDTGGCSALHYAIEPGHEALVFAIIDLGADVNAQGDDGYTPLHVAVQESNPSLVKALLATGADVSLKNRDGVSPLASSWFLDAEAAELLLDAGADVNERDQDLFSPLIHASCDDGNAALLELLLARGADIDAHSNGTTALHEAVSKTSDAEMLTLLLAAGADPHALDNEGMSPLMLAKKEKKLEFVELLSKHARA